MEELKDYGLAIEVEKIAKAIDGDTIDQTYGFCTYCEAEELNEILKANDGLCSHCADAQDMDWREAR